MKLLRFSGTLYLEHDGCRVPLEGTDLSYILRMTPQGRKIYFRNKAKARLQRDRGDNAAVALLQWFLLPAREWSFAVPPDVGGSG